MFTIIMENVASVVIQMQHGLEPKQTLYNDSVFLHSLTPSPQLSNLSLSHSLSHTLTLKWECCKEWEAGRVLFKLNNVKIHTSWFELWKYARVGADLAYLC